jgi:rhodanese-related sulfurtransferase
MRVILGTAGQIILLVALASAVALAVNPRRGKNTIDLDNVYFPPGGVIAEPPSDANTSPGDPNAQPFPFTVIDLEGVKHAVADARLLTGEIVIVDARSDEPYQAGRIPGAIQFDYYRAEYYAEAIPRAMAAEQVIIYCNGGSCEDSLLTCQHFVSLGIPANHLCLFKDGWEAWKTAGLPIETGHGEE